MKPEDFVYVAPNGVTYAMDQRHRPWWKWSSDYAPISQMTNPRIAWEFLWRNPKYFQAFFAWKFQRSEALMDCVLEDHPRWKAIEKEKKRICLEFGLDPSFPLCSPLVSNSNPIFLSQVRLTNEQTIVFLQNDKDMDRLVQSPPWGRSCYVTMRGRGWPRKKAETMEPRVNRRFEFPIYLRLLDARAQGADSQTIRLWLECYRGKSREDAQKALNTHWKAAIRMMSGGYKGLAANH